MLFLKQKMSADNYFIKDQNAVYFLTFTVTDWIDIFIRKEYKIEIVNSKVGAGLCRGKRICNCAN